ncbi:MAG: hypothetical protein HXY24_06720 [Rubrivivax sp.]|nr:hypothetical protein [Rubrivivax sp.]
MPLLGVLGLFAAVGHAEAQPARSTQVLGVVAAYTDASRGVGGPAQLRKVLLALRAFYAEGSGGAHEFVGDVHPGIVQLAQARPVGKCRLPDGSVLSAALRDAGIGLEHYHALALVVPASTGGCNGGLQTTFLHREADGTTRRVPLAVSWSMTDRFIAHEIVHTHGIGHAKTLVCPGASVAAACKTGEYGNVWDLMGNGKFQMLSAPLRTRMGWIEPVIHPGGQATYTIGAATRPDDLPTAVQVRLPFSGNDAVKVLQPLSLWVEYRAPFGFDKPMGSPRFNFAQGAMVNLTGSWQTTTGRSSRLVSCPSASPCLLDMTPQTPKFKDAALLVGQTFTEPFSGTRLRVESRSETTLTFTVTVP